MKYYVIFSLLILIACFAADSLDVRLLGRYTPCSPMDIYVYENTAYLANSSGGLMLLDITDPSSMSSPGYLFLSGEATSIDRLGDNVAVACSDNSLRILDPADPTDIEIVGEYYSSYSVENCFVLEDTVYANGGSFSILDASDPSSISLLGDFTSVFAAEDIFVKSPYAYLAEDNYGLSIVDISDPTSPVSFGRYFGLEEFVRSIYVDKWDRLFIGTDEELMVYRQTADSIEHLGSWTAPEPVLDIEVDGIYAFMACGNQGLRIVDVSDPASITEVGYYVLGSEMTELFLDYPRIWAVGVWARVNCFDITPFADISENIAMPDKKDISVYPSPFNAVCRVDGPKGRAAIYDIRGSLVDEITVPGYWRPNENLPSGTYLIKPFAGQSAGYYSVLLMR